MKNPRYNKPVLVLTTLVLQNFVLTINNQLEEELDHDIDVYTDLGYDTRYAFLFFVAVFGIERYLSQGIENEESPFGRRT